VQCSWFQGFSEEGGAASRGKVSGGGDDSSNKMVKRRGGCRIGNRKKTLDWGLGGEIKPEPFIFESLSGRRLFLRARGKRGVNLLDERWSMKSSWPGKQRECHHFKGFQRVSL